MFNPLVSIIIPVYNVEPYLEHCLESIINQTYKNLQIIIVNDGSTDNSPAICDKFAEKDNRIVVIHKKNGGVSSARNVGLGISQGSYILFVDSDDWIETDMVEHLINISIETNVDVVLFGIYNEDYIQMKTYTIHFNSDLLVDKDHLLKLLPGWVKDEKINTIYGKLYLADIIKSNNIRFDESLNIAEDALFNYEVFLHVESVYLLRACFYHYMIIDAESLSKRYNPGKYEMLNHVNGNLLELIQNNKIYSGLLQSAHYIRIKNLFSCLVDVFMYEKKTYREKRNLIADILKKEENHEYHNTGSILHNILYAIFKTNNISLVYIASLIIY
ncbi:MAG TPA: glycosyltransferase, partial [Clostridiales bacterium]|nr:glycosyltransferase [Clostridiales bacterium]